MAHAVVGLGNPGPEYRGTRHNVGQRVLDALATQLKKAWRRDGQAMVAHASWRGEPLHLIKPLTFMNVSGPAVAAALRRADADTGDLILVYDDIDLPLGTVRVAVHPVGEAIGVKDTKGILSLVLHELEVSCLPGNIPERIDADVSNLAIGDVLTVANLAVPEGVRILNDPGQAIATVSPPMAEEVAAPVVAAAAAEPEVLTERKPKEGEAAAAAPADDGKKAKKEK